MKRFYRHAEIMPAATAFGVALDGKPVRTPAKRDLVVPTYALAAALAAEWNTQRDESGRPRCR